MLEIKVVSLSSPVSDLTSGGKKKKEKLLCLSELILKLKRPYFCSPAEKITASQTKGNKHTQKEKKKNL